MKKPKREKNLKSVKGFWLIDISVKQSGGKLKRLRASFPTKTEAQANLDRIRSRKAMRRLGLEVPEVKSKDMLFETYAEKILARQADLRPNYKKSQRIRLNALLRSPLFGGRRLCEITTADIAQHHSERGATMKPAANAELQFLNMVLARAVEDGELGKNPAKPIKRYRLGLTRLRILADAEATLLLNAASPNIVPLVRLLLTTGMRPHEAFALHWEFDGWETEKKLSRAIVALDRRIIFIPHLLSKNHKDREVPLSPELVDMFRGMARKPAGSKVFPWVDTPDGFADAVKAAKLKNVTLYTLKHTAASRMIKAGVDIVTVAEVLGHSDIKQTIRYCHSDGQSKRDAIARVSQVYFKPAQVADAPAPAASDHRDAEAEGMVS